jgi:hypothetical protein
MVVVFAHHERLKGVFQIEGYLMDDGGQIPFSGFGRRLGAALAGRNAVEAGSGRVDPTSSTLPLKTTF